MSFFKKITLSFFLVTLTILPSFVGAAGFDDSLKEAGQSAGYDTAASFSPQLMVARFIKIALGFIGIIMVCLTLYAGFLWMTSQGNAQQIAKAKGIMEAAVIGLFIVLSSYTIADFVIRSLANSSGK